MSEKISYPLTSDIGAAGEAEIAHKTRETRQFLSIRSDLTIPDRHERLIDTYVYFELRRPMKLESLNSLVLSALRGVA